MFWWIQSPCSYLRHWILDGIDIFTVMGTSQFRTASIKGWPKPLPIPTHYKEITPPPHTVVVYLFPLYILNNELPDSYLTKQKYFRPVLVHPLPSHLPVKFHIAWHKQPDFLWAVKFIHLIMHKPLYSDQSPSMKELYEPFRGVYPNNLAPQNW